MEIFVQHNYLGYHMDNRVNVSTLIPHILQYDWWINSDASVYNKQIILAINLEMIYLWEKCCFAKYGTNYLQFVSKNFSQQKITFCGFKVFPWMTHMSESINIVNATQISFLYLNKISYEPNYLQVWESYLYYPVIICIVLRKYKA